jgi:hypothetical protein
LGQKISPERPSKPQAAGLRHPARSAAHARSGEACPHVGKRVEFARELIGDAATARVSAGGEEPGQRAGPGGGDLEEHGVLVADRAERRDLVAAGLVHPGLANPPRWLSQLQKTLTPASV